MARGWTIGGVGEPTREAVTAAASEAGMPLGQWVEQALMKALAEGLEAGVSIEEIEARLRQVVAEALQPVQQALAQLETLVTARARRTAARPSAGYASGCGSAGAGEPCDRLE